MHRRKNSQLLACDGYDTTPNESKLCGETMITRIIQTGPFVLGCQLSEDIVNI